MKDNRSLEFLNGDWINGSDHTVSLTGAGLFYGAGCFETLLVEESKIFKFNEHMKRLLDGLRYLGRESNSLPEPDQIRGIISELLLKKGLNERKCRVRVQCSLPDRGYETSADGAVILHITADKISSPTYSKVKLCRVNTKVVPSVCRPSHLKLSNMLHYRQAYHEAQLNGSDDAIMLNMNHFVAETSKANIFWMKGDHIYTPSAECDILPGIMRNSIVDILHKSFKEVYLTEGEFDFSSLADSDFIWVTNSIQEISGVSHLDNLEIGQNVNFLLNLKEKLMQYKKDYME
jgi:branched-subunit amino acid aminotransferase/4-amino-4-deoxychorismate lyase